MKIFYALFISIVIFSSLFCNYKPENIEECLPLELTVKNTSYYIIKELYVHDLFDYTSGGSDLIASDMAMDSEVPVAVSDGEVKYFTFIRNITSTSVSEIAVTTKTPITFSNCHNYILNLLAEDFFLQDTGSSDAAKSIDSEIIDIK